MSVSQTAIYETKALEWANYILQILADSLQLFVTLFISWLACFTNAGQHFRVEAAEVSGLPVLEIVVSK